MQALTKIVQQNVIEKLRIVGSFNSVESFVELFTALKDNTSLKILVLDLCHLGSERSKALAEFSEANTLTKLDLMSCSMGIEGVQFLAEGLKNNTSLKNLGLSLAKDNILAQTNTPLPAFVIPKKSAKPSNLIPNNP